MPTRGLMLPTREIGPRLSGKSKSLASLIACAAACVAGRFRMVVLNGHRHVGKTMCRGSRDCWVLLFAWALPRWTRNGRNRAEYGRACRCRCFLKSKFC